MLGLTEMLAIIPLPLDFYHRPPPQVARDLLGALLCRREEDHSVTCGRIVETEAYLGADDPASHASGRRTERNAVMFDSPGHAYVYFIYGNHFCFNAVSFERSPGAVLVRAVEPVAGLERMRARRGAVSEKMLTNGPGKLAQAFDITRALNGVALYDASSPVCIARSDAPLADERIAVTTRVGIRQAIDMPLRFYDRASTAVSRP